MKNNQQKDTGSLQDKVLFIGTNEHTAKLAPLKGLEAPIFLTDVYPAFFCKQNCLNGERWGILSVSLKDLLTDRIAPSPFYVKKFTKSRQSIDSILAKIANYRSKWQKSLTSCGVCVYTATIPPHAIQKIMIYNVNGRDTNVAVNQLVSELPEPNSITPSEHKSAYQKSLGLSRWFNGEEVRCEDIYNGQSKSLMAREIDDKLTNRLALDLYYIKSEEKYKRNK